MSTPHPQDPAGPDDPGTNEEEAPDEPDFQDAPDEDPGFAAGRLRALRANVG